jgi:hypothetical protein
MQLLKQRNLSLSGKLHILHKLQHLDFRNVDLGAKVPSGLEKNTLMFLKKS